VSHHTLSVLVENRPGVLTRCAGLFARRGFNIDSLAVGTTQDPSRSRITIRIDCEQHSVDQVIKQLYKLVDVLKVHELDATAVELELLMIKVASSPDRRPEIISLAEVFALHGEAYYRRLERAALDRILAEGRPVVLATGGGLPTTPATYARLRAEALTVWLRATPEDHWNRVVQQGDRRPMADQPSMADALWRSLMELRLAGVKAAVLPRDAFTSEAKWRELGALLDAYERHLELNRIADAAQGVTCRAGHLRSGQLAGLEVLLSAAPGGAQTAAARGRTATQAGRTR
jgi:shikimate kinase/acetolactate synthase regulatory subunit